MDSLERRLIELNSALMRLSTGEKVEDEVLQKAYQTMAGSLINTGPGNDTVIINTHIGPDKEEPCVPCSPGPKGDKGDPGPKGDKGDPGPKGDKGDPGDCDCECDRFCQQVLVQQDYTATEEDFYIGVNSTGPVTITLPPNESSCQQIIVKAEMGPPLGNRKVTIVCPDSGTIDGALSYVMTTPYESVQLFNDGTSSWFVI